VLVAVGLAGATAIRAFCQTYYPGIAACVASYIGAGVILIGAGAVVCMRTGGKGRTACDAGLKACLAACDGKL
jgi:hypothetical protein